LEDDSWEAVDEKMKVKPKKQKCRERERSDGVVG
jgi:hypothetical protein